MSDDLYDYQPQTNPFQMPPNEPDTQPGQPDVGTPAPQPVMSVEQALEQVPKTLTYRDLAVAHLRKMEGQAQEQNDVGSPEFKMAPAHTVNTGQQEQQLLDVKSHPDFQNALEKVRGQDSFTLNDREYYKYGSQLYRKQNAIPAVGIRIEPSEAEQIINERARQDFDPPIIEMTGPIGAVADAMTSFGTSISSGLPIMNTLKKTATSLAGGLVKGVGKDYLLR